jgi:CheY-like chemotaxis protein
MHVLVGSSSAFRQQCYRESVEVLGHRVSIATDGLECIRRIKTERPDLLILEAPLLWGGAEGVLELVQAESRANRLPVILVAIGAGSIDWFQLSRFRIDHLLFRLPTAHELSRAIAEIAQSQVGSPYQPVAAEDRAFV